MQNSVTLKNIEFNNDKKIILIAGPCVLESMNHAKMMVEHLLRITSKLDLNFIYNKLGNVPYTSVQCIKCHSDK